jgi:transcription termination/antitermination protein NusG
VSGWTHRFGNRFPQVGDAVTVTEGTFESFDGTVEAIDEEHGKITISIEVFGRQTPVEVAYWQVKRI